MSALTIEDLSVAYGPLTAVDSVTFTVEPGHCTSILGANGSGKTSLASAIIGWVTPSNGTIRFGDLDITTAAPKKTLAAGIALVPERRQLFLPLSVGQNLALGGYRRGRAERQESLDRVLSMFPDLADRLSARAGNLSGGQQQMLAIGRALMSDPQVLLLDEPSLGLAPLVVKGVGELLQQILDAGTSVVIVEQNSRLALELSTEVVILSQGDVVAKGSASELLANNAELLAMFLG